MGEARRRGTRAERRRNAKGRPDSWGLSFYAYVGGAKKAKQRSATPKRERAKMKRAIKKRFGLGRRALGAIGAGHRPAPLGMLYLASRGRS